MIQNVRNWQRERGEARALRVTMVSFSLLGGKAGKHLNKIKAEAEPDFSQNKEESVLSNSVLSLAILVEKCAKQNSLFMGEGRWPSHMRPSVRPRRRGLEAACPPVRLSVRLSTRPPRLGLAGARRPNGDPSGIPGRCKWRCRHGAFSDL